MKCVLTIDLSLLLLFQAADKLFDDIHWLIVHSLKAVQVCFSYLIHTSHIWFPECHV